MLLLLALAFVAADAQVAVKDDPPPFSLDAGFIEAVPEAPIHVVIDDAAPRDELVLDVVRIGALGKGRAKLIVTVDKTKRPLTVVAPTVDTRKVGGQFASLPVRLRIPLPTGSASVQIDVEETMGLRLTVATTPPPGEIPLAPLTDDAPAPVATPRVPSEDASPAPVPEPAPTSPAVSPAMAPTPADGAAAAVAADAAQPAKPAASADDAPAGAAKEPVLPKLYAEVHAGGSLLANGLQSLVPAGGFRLLVGPHALDAAIGFAVDFDGQGAFLDPAHGGGRWDAATTRVRVEGMFGIGYVGLVSGDVHVSVGAGARFTQHSVHAKGNDVSLLTLGGTARVSPEAAFPAGPGVFTIAVPVDVGADLSPVVHNFAPVAAGMLLGYRLEL